MNQLFALAPKTWNDLCGIMTRRWWAALIIAAAVGCWVEVFHVQAGGTLASGPFILVLISIWFVVFPEAMRIDNPAYVLNVQRFAPLALLALFVALIGLLISVPILLLNALLQHGVGPIASTVLDFLVLLAFQSKFSFVFYAADSTDSPIAYSWRATGGHALVATAVLTIIAMVSPPIIDVTFDMLARGFGPIAPLANVLDVVTHFAFYAFLAAWTIRWMRVAESMQMVTVTG